MILPCNILSYQTTLQIMEEDILNYSPTVMFLCLNQTQLDLTKLIILKYYRFTTTGCKVSGLDRLFIKQIYFYFLLLIAKTILRFNSVILN